MLPFCVIKVESFSSSWAKDYLIQILEQQFQTRDEGGGLEEASRSEDLEPMPAPPDAWAQECLPLVHASPHTKPISPKVFLIIFYIFLQQI